MNGDPVHLIRRGKQIRETTNLPACSSWRISWEIAFLNLRALLGLVLAILFKIGIGCMTVVQVVYLVREGVLSNEEFLDD